MKMLAAAAVVASVEAVQAAAPRTKSPPTFDEKVKSAQKKTKSTLDGPAWKHSGGERSCKRARVRSPNAREMIQQVDDLERNPFLSPATKKRYLGGGYGKK